MNDATMNKELSRRGFMALTAMGAASVLFPLAACSSESPKQASSGDMSAADTPMSEEDIAIQNARDQISNMTLEQKVAQIFVVRPEDLLGFGVADGTVQDVADASGDAVTEMSDALARAIEAMPVGGIVCFARNLVDPDQTISLLSGMKGSVQDACGVTPLICVDEEGGLVARVASNDAFGVQNTGNASDIGATGDIDKAKEAARSISEYLKPLGFNTDFAPVVDVSSDPDDEVSVARSMGTDAEQVASMISAEVEGFNEEDMICALKHFPGLGAASGDTHLGTVTTQKTADDLMQKDLIPFKAGIDAGAPMVMVGHMSAPNVDELDQPSVMSSILLKNVLRRDLGFEGVIITDALNMGAITDHYDSGSAAINCIKAGCDMLLMPEDLPSAFNAVMETVKSGVISSEELNVAVARILLMKQKYLK